jgi:hypothetical protein
MPRYTTIADIPCSLCKIDGDEAVADKFYPIRIQTDGYRSEVRIYLPLCEKHSREWEKNPDIDVTHTWKAVTK